MSRFPSFKEITAVLKADKKHLLPTLFISIPSWLNRINNCERQVLSLHKHFSSNEGMNTLMWMFIQAETAYLTETLGIFDVEENDYRSLAAPKENQELYKNVGLRDTAAIDGLISELSEQLKVLHQMDATQHCEINQKFMDDLIHYRDGGGDHDNILFDLKKYLVSHTHYPDNINHSKEIVLHVHKLNDKSDEGNYSEPDRSTSYFRALGLVSYFHELNGEGDRHVMNIDFYVRHRIWTKEYSFGPIKVTLDEKENKMTYTLADDSQATSSVTPMELSKKDVSFFLSISPDVLPFICYDPSKDLESDMQNPGILEGIENLSSVAREFVPKVWGTKCSYLKNMDGIL